MKRFWLGGHSGRRPQSPRCASEKLDVIESTVWEPENPARWPDGVSRRSSSAWGERRALQFI
jgi:hypothetical protein